uniref:Spectrin repeat-containing domain protein n=1 Tax=Heterorhabditis bacteriophora TaxID=37862 RepID=A0A1I7X912_HETBA
MVTLRCQLTIVVLDSSRLIHLKQFIKQHTLHILPDAQKDFLAVDVVGCLGYTHECVHLRLSYIIHFSSPVTIFHKKFFLHCLASNEIQMLSRRSMLSRKEYLQVLWKRTPSVSTGHNDWHFSVEYAVFGGSYYSNYFVRSIDYMRASKSNCRIGWSECRRRSLEDTVYLYEYMRESADLEQWINEQLQTAMSEDYGEDYEHFKELQSKFEEFKQSVRTGSERFVSCEAAANSLLRRNPPFGRDVLRKQEKLRSVWTLLLDYIESREAKLTAAEELHRFNQDVLEHEEWVLDKKNTISHDKGRNLQQAKSLSQKHETLEKEVLVMESQLKRLLEESARLKEAYPGGNAEHIASQQVELTESWQDLLNAIADRKDDLRAARDMHRFQAEGLQKEHSRLKGEIDARAPGFERVSAAGISMIEQEHYESLEINHKVQQITAALDRLRTEWELRDSYLGQLVQWHAFQQEVNQILTLIISKRATLRQFAVGGSVVDVEGQKKRLDTFTKALSTLDERTKILDFSAKELVSGNHMEKNNIEMSGKKVELLNALIFDDFKKVHDALIMLHTDVEQRKRVLNEEFSIAAFDRDVSETEAWIDERLKGYELLLCSMRFLHNNQLMALQYSFGWLSLPLSLNENLMQTGCFVYRINLNSVFHVDRVLSWVREKELMVTAADMGRDLEHCKMLLDRRCSYNSNILIKRMLFLKKISELYLLSVYYIFSWMVLLSKLSSYRRDLTAALEVHCFNRDVDDTNERIHEKIGAMHNDDYGRDFATWAFYFFYDLHYVKNFHLLFFSVDALLRKQTTLERDMSAIHQKLIAHDADAQNILAKVNYKLHKYIDQVKKAEHWASIMRNKMTSYKTPSSTAEAKQLKEQHTERKAEIDGRQVEYLIIKILTGTLTTTILSFDDIKVFIEELHVLHEEGQRLISEQPEHKPEVQRAHKRVQNSEHQLRQTWESEKV